MYGPSPNPPPSQGAPSSDSLQSAIAYLRRGLRPDGTYAGIDEWEIYEHQWGLLREWADRADLILPAGTMLARAGGQEHDVYHDPETGRWLKFTKPARAGYTVEMVGDKPQMFPATPLQYLRRWRLNNRLFADDVELIGLVDGREMRIGISQRDLVGEAPSWEELHQAMTEVYGLRLLHLSAFMGAYDARAYAKDRFAIFDVRPANCVRTAEGDVVPFDVIPQAFSQEDAATLRKLRE